MTSPRVFLVAAVLSLATFPAGADPAGSWGLAVRAAVDAPDGSALETILITLPDGRALFRQSDGAAETRLLVDAAGQVRRWADESGTWEPQDAVWAEFVHGHDAHRLFLAACAGHGTPPDSLTRDIPADIGGGRVVLVFAEPAHAPEGDLPRRVTFRHEAKNWVYRYQEVLPFVLGPGAPLPDDPAGLADRLADLHAIAAGHERALEAHRRGDLDLLMADQAARGFNSGRGRLTGASREETRSRLGPYLAATTFTRYEDVVAPRIAVAADGSLAWLACEIEAEGVQAGPEGAAAIAFGYSWVEMLARDGGRWVRVGNASSGRE